MKKSAAQLDQLWTSIRQTAEPHDPLNERVLGQLAEGLNCLWATYWQVDTLQMRLIPAALWQHPSVAAEPLVRDTKNMQLTLSQGTAGHVWRSQKPVCTTNLIQDMCLPRSIGARSAGLQGGIWFAVKTDRAVYGVLEFLGPAFESSPEALTALEQFGFRLGGAVEETDDRP
jgi:hypothetical protein